MKNKLKEILIKLKDYKLVLFFLLVIGGAFYWYELRPIFIKKQCSWFTYTTQTPSIPAFNGVTKEEAVKKFEKIQRDYKNLCGNNFNKLSDGLCAYMEIDSHSSVEQLQESPRPAIPAGPVEKVIRNASKIEYDSCLRHKGI
ncbi:MAG: hypothetical protein Q8O89_04090 [Nanoarchaeota archaeon]|nr:hypothetical protein [Nanoarchaeota archaeon]